MWVEKHGDALFRYAYLRVNSHEIAEDLVQETLLAAVRGYDSFEGRSSVKTWLIGILKNKIIDHIRKTVRRNKNESLDQEDDVLDRHFNRLGIWTRVLGDWAEDPDEIMERKDFFRVLEGCLGKVPEKGRRAFTLKMLEQVESKEICKILDITASNLWVLLHRCRLSLRECLEKNWAERPQRSD